MSKKNKSHSKKVRIRPGSVVRIRNIQDIRRSLDNHGSLDGLPFMPEMRRYCGGVYKVSKCVNRILVEGNGVRGFDKVYILDGVRCDGCAHNHCQRLCQIFWKESWLDPNISKQTAPISVSDLRAPHRTENKTDKVLPCHGQASVLLSATEPLPFWNLNQYWEDIRTGGFSVFKTITVLFRSVFGRIYLRLLWIYRDRFQVNKAPSNFHYQPTPFNPGDWVEVRSKTEIEKTLDSNRKLQGLSFAEVMRGFCGKQFKVVQAVDFMIVEETGKRQKVRDTYLLENVTCTGELYRGCPRLCYWFWKGAWLKHAVAPAQNTDIEDGFNTKIELRRSRADSSTCSIFVDGSEKPFEGFSSLVTPEHENESVQ